jgi:hypothetical protein
MDLMPVSDQSKDEQYYGNHEQSSGFRGIHGVAMVPMLGFVVGMGSGHADIVIAGGRSWLGVKSWVLGSTFRCELAGSVAQDLRPNAQDQGPRCKRRC